jgi:hypothetical protein
MSILEDWRVGRVHQPEIAARGENESTGRLREASSISLFNLMEQQLINQHRLAPNDVVAELKVTVRFGPHGRRRAKYP